MMSFWRDFITAPEWMTTILVTEYLKIEI